MSEQRHRRDSTDDATLERGSARTTPGRATLTQHLQRTAAATPAPASVTPLDGARRIQLHRAQERDLAAAMGYFEEPVTHVQRSRDGHTGLADDDVRAVAAQGVAGGGGALPHLDIIQRSFGAHDVSGVRAHVGGAAASASDALGAEAYATGASVAFRAPPSLFLAAHEAAHVVQQRAGVQFSGAVGQEGDAYERHADAVAARVVAGDSAEDLLGAGAAASHGSATIQRAPGGKGQEQESRFGAHESYDAASRVLMTSVVAGPLGEPMTRIVIGVPAKAGIYPGMPGYVKLNSGKLAGFQITEVHGHVAYALVQVDPKETDHGNDVVINPKTMPASAAMPSDPGAPTVAPAVIAQHDVRTRYLKTEVAGDRQIRLYVGFGAARGAKEGMQGFLLDGAGGRAYHFALDSVSERWSTAMVTATLDEVLAHPDVLVNPSK